MWATTLWNEGMPLIQWGAVIGASLVAAATDVSRRRIPNRLTGPVLLAGLVWSTCTGGMAGLFDSLTACVVLAIPYVLLFVLAGGGAGDAKLMGAIGAWVGMINGLVVLAAVAAAGIVLGIVSAVARRRVRSVLAHLTVFLYGVAFVMLGRRRLRERLAALPAAETMQKVPYGVAILVGVCLAAGGVALWTA